MQEGARTQPSVTVIELQCGGLEITTRYIHQLIGEKVRVMRKNAPTRYGILQASARIRGFLDVLEVQRDGRRKAMMLDADSISSVEPITDVEESEMLGACICGSSYADFRRCPTHRP
jgi:hypothetical protein